MFPLPCFRSWLQATFLLVGWLVDSFSPLEKGTFFWGAWQCQIGLRWIFFFFRVAKWDESLKVQKYFQRNLKCQNVQTKNCPYNSSIETSIRIPGSTGASPYHRVFSCQPCGMETPPCYQKLMVTRPNQHEHHPTMLYQHGFKEKTLYILVGGFQPIWKISVKMGIFHK